MHISVVDDPARYDATNPFPVQLTTPSARAGTAAGPASAKCLASRAHHVPFRALILHSFLAELSNRTESLTLNVLYLAFSIADNASRF
jgi:hypothetical protein